MRGGAPHASDEAPPCAPAGVGPIERIAELGGPLAAPGVARGCRHDPRERTNRGEGDDGPGRAIRAHGCPAFTRRACRTGLSACSCCRASFTVARPALVTR